MKVFSQIHVHTKHFFYNKECKDKQNIRKDKFYFSCGKINKYDHLQHIFQIHFHKMRQIIVYDNSISTCMGNFHKTEYLVFFKNCNGLLYFIHQKNYLELNLVENIDK